jgi:hypothetical protein
MKTLQEIISPTEKSDSLVSHYDKFTPEHKEAIKNYTATSWDTNRTLWHLHEHGHSHDNEYSKQNLSHLDSAMEAHKTPHDMTVYSGTAQDPRNPMDPNKTVHHPAYLSTSTSKDVAHSFAHSNAEKGEGYSSMHLLHIHVPKETKGAYVDHVSNSPGEKEFILPRGTNLKWHETETEPYTDDDGEDYEIHHHHMSVVP